MSARCAPTCPVHSYFVVMIDYGRKGREAIVDPEITYRGVVDRVVSGEYRNICFIHYIMDECISDVTEEVLADAERVPA